MDGNGNLTARGTDGFTYDQANRLKTASVGGTASAYSYDGDGKRSSKTVGGTPTNYVYDVNASLPVLLDDGTRKYVWGLGLAFAVDASGSPLVYHTDGLGSVRALTDSSGSVVQSYTYDEYGNVLSSTGSITQPFQYTGEQRDETGLVYLRTRYYEPGAGRFVSRDTWPGSGTLPASLNRYTYAMDNPANLVDPSGQCAALAAGLRDECETMKRKIEGLAERQERRFNAMRADENFLWRDYRTLKNPMPGTGWSWEGHQLRYRLDQSDLAREIGFYYIKCGDRFGGLPSEVTQWEAMKAPMRPDYARISLTNEDVGSLIAVARDLLILYVSSRTGRPMPTWQKVPVPATSGAPGW